MKFGPPDKKQSQMMLLGCGSSGSGVSYTPPLDAVTAKCIAVFGLHRLFAGVTEALRVRESGGSTEQDVGTLAAGDFDAASFTSFINGADGFAAKAYDHKGANDMVQATAGSQPQITGTIGTNTRAALTFASGNNMRTGNVLAPWGTGDFEFWCVFNPSLLTTDRCLGTFSNYRPSFYCSTTSSGVGGLAKPGFWDNTAYRWFDTTLSTGTDYIIRFYRVSGVMFCDINNVTEATSHAYTIDNSGADQPFALGTEEGIAGSATPYVGKMAFAGWFSGLTSGEASALVTALSDYFGITLGA